MRNDLLHPEQFGRHRISIKRPRMAVLGVAARCRTTASDSATAHAIIADGSGNEQSYFIRDSIPGGATLHQVHPDRVILNRGGMLEALRLPREFAGGAAPTRSRRR